MAEVYFSTSIDRIIDKIDYSKLGKKARIHTLPLSAINIMVTNAKPIDAVAAALQQAEVELIHG